MVEVQCLLSSSLVHLLHVIRECCSMAVSSSPSSYSSPLPPLSSKRPAELSFEANKRLKESPDCQVLQKYDDPACQQENCIVERVLFASHLDFDSTVGVVTPDAIEKENVKFKVEERKMRRRPTKLLIPEPCTGSGFLDDEKEKNVMEKELEVKGSGYCLASRRGHRHVMEDGYGVISSINGDSKQAFFGVFDGHGGHEAVGFVSENLGKNIISALAHIEKEENQLELAIKAGYLTTDNEFINQGVKSGACAATVLLKDGELHAANVGDCRVVLSRKGIATALTRDHHAGREDERKRIEDSGGYITCRNGVCRVQDSLAVSRAIGDANMKEWIISEPETNRIRLTPDCEFLIMASDGLWGKVTNQEAVDVVLKHNDSMKSCKDLVELSCSRGSRDDITVMVVNLQHYVQLGEEHYLGEKS